MEEPTCYVRVDEHGVMRAGAARIMLDSVVLPFQRGDSAESIRSQYPALTLEEVYGAIAYYLQNREQVDTYLKKQEELWEYWRAKAEETPSPVVERLRALKAGSVTGPGT
jgi:hypothetical protein